MNLGAFAIVTMLGRAKDAKVKLTDYAGLAFEAARTGGAVVAVPAFAGRRSRYGWLCRQVFHLQVGRGVEPDMHSRSSVF